MIDLTREGCEHCNELCCEENRRSLYVINEAGICFACAKKTVRVSRLKRKRIMVKEEIKRRVNLALGQLDLEEEEATKWVLAAIEEELRVHISRGEDCIFSDHVIWGQKEEGESIWMPE